MSVGGWAPRRISARCLLSPREHKTKVLWVPQKSEFWKKKKRKGVIFPEFGVLLSDSLHLIKTVHVWSNFWPLDLDSVSLSQQKNMNHVQFIVLRVCGHSQLFLCSPSNSWESQRYTFLQQKGAPWWGVCGSNSSSDEKSPICSNVCC